MIAVFTGVVSNIYFVRLCCECQLATYNLRPWRLSVIFIYQWFLVKREEETKINLMDEIHEPI